MEMTDNNEKVLRSLHSQHKEISRNNLALNPDISHEVFRNETTSVEVIVKGVSGKRKKSLETAQINTDITIRNKNKEIEGLKKELQEANIGTDSLRETSRTITFEIKKQLERSHQRELKEQTKNLSLQLENMKLRALLESKTDLVKKLMKELMNVRRVIKLIVKSLNPVSHTPDMSNNSDAEYRMFESELKNSFLLKSLGTEGYVFDSTI